MPEQPTCGKGLEQNAALPAKLADVLDAVAENLSAHMTALDPGDQAAREERDAYAELLARHRAIVDELRALSKEMASYRDLPMAPHDPEVMRGPTLRDPFQLLVEVEKELRAYLDGRISREEEMLTLARRS
jgi:hypothetical protein